MTRGRVSLMAAGATALAVLSGCNTTEPGTPSASGNGGATSASATPKPGTSTSTPKSTAANTDLDPCSLLPDSNATAMGLPTPGKAKKISGLSGCIWTASGQFTVSMGIDNKGLAGLNGQSVALPKHKAVKVANAGGFIGCGVVVEISDKASVIISVALSDGQSGEAACPRAEEVAKIVDSTLP